MSMTQELGSNWVLSSEKNGGLDLINKSAEDERQEMSTTINYTGDISMLGHIVANGGDEAKLAQLQQ